MDYHISQIPCFILKKQFLNWDYKSSFRLIYLIHFFFLLFFHKIGRYTDIKTTKTNKQRKGGKGKDETKRVFVAENGLKWRADKNGVLEIPYLFDGKRMYSFILKVYTISKETFTNHKSVPDLVLHHINCSGRSILIQSSDLNYHKRYK